jgi:hypothetical protein
MIWMIRLTQCLGLYNPLIILPLMVATYILFGGVSTSRDGRSVTVRSRTRH